MVEFAKKTEAEISKVQDLTKLFIKMQTEAQQKAEQENRALIEKMQASFNEQIKQIMEAQQKQLELVKVKSGEKEVNQRVQTAIAESASFLPAIS